MNKVVLIGRLTKDPDVRYSQGENSMAIARFSIAVDRKTKSGEEKQADYPNCVAFGKVAELIEKYVHKGNRFGVIGHIQTGSYTNRDGVKVYTTDVMVDEIEFLESKGNSDSGSNHQAQGRQEVNPTQKKETPGFMNVPDNVSDDGLPFN